MDGKQGLYLFIACYNSESEKQEAFVVVTKAMLSEEVASRVENISDHVIIFASDMSLGQIKEKLKYNKVPYLLIDISASYDLESIAGFLPQSQLEIIKEISLGKFSKNKPRIKQLLDRAVSDDNFELAVPLRDLTKNEKDEDRAGRTH